MSRHSFKVGDKVKVVPNDHQIEGDPVIGGEHTVTHVTGSFVHITGHTGGWFPERFELVLPEVKAERRISADTQLGKVLNLTLGGGQWTLAGIASVTGASEAAVSARLRDLRAAGYEVTCVKHRGDAQRSYTVRNKVITVGSDAAATVG